jgi:hypothetical protein
VFDGMNRKIPKKSEHFVFKDENTARDIWKEVYGEREVKDFKIFGILNDKNNEITDLDKSIVSLANRTISKFIIT